MLRLVADEGAAPAAALRATCLPQWQVPGPVLVVEDNAVNQEVIQALLARYGLAAELAGDGAVAVAMAQARSYPLVLMDMHMPLMGRPGGHAASGAWPCTAARPSSR
ncbi:MAG: response regulator [Burkholderiaceae bacterium]